MMTAPRLTVRSLFEQVYLPKKRKLADRTRRKIQHELTRWEKISGNPTLDAMDDSTFDDARDAALEMGFSADTIETTIGSVLTVLRFAKKKGEIDSVPDEGEKLARSNRRKPVPRISDLNAAYLHADAARWPRLFDLSPGEFWRAWLVVSYFTGLRLGDMMFRLSWELVTEDSLATEASKTGKFHVFPMHPVLSRHLELMRGFRTPRIFPVSNSPMRIRRELARISRVAGLEVNIAPQALRRLAGTQWQKAKWGAGQTLLGHTLGVSDRYIAPEILQEAVRLLEIPPAFLTEEERGVSVARNQLDESDRAMLRQLMDKLNC